MSIELLSAQNYRVSNWSGGQTTQVYIYPEHSSYAERDFTFRISAASIRESPSVFTQLEQYDRILVSTEQSIVLQLQDKNVDLETYTPFYFSGAEPVTSIGTTTDFNVMMRKGHKATLAILHMEGHYEAIPVPDCVQLWYVAQCNASVHLGDKVLTEKDSAILRHTDDMTMHSTIPIVIEGSAIIFQVCMYL